MNDYKFNNDQELRRYVMKEFVPDDWQAAYDFLKAGEKTFEVISAKERTYNAYEAYCRLNNKGERTTKGVYIVYENDVHDLFNGNNSKDGVKYIGLDFGGHCFGVSLRHIEKATLPSGTTVQGRYFKGDIPALDDFDGEGNTETLKQRGGGSLGSDLDGLNDGEWIPSLGELAVIYRAKDLLNKALEYVGGDIIPDKWHWSSTEYDPHSAWLLVFGTGNLYGGSKCNSIAVRAVCAF